MIIVFLENYILKNSERNPAKSKAEIAYKPAYDL